MAAIVIYFSRAGENYFGGTYRYTEVGNTEIVAKMVAELTGSDIFRVEMKEPYAKEYKACVAEVVRDRKANARPELNEYLEQLESYDTIYVGYPSYCGTMPMVMYTALEKYDLSGKVIKPFCTNEGSGMGTSEADLKNLCKGAKIRRGLSILGREAAESKGIVEEWLKEE